ncbi:thiamine metabolism- protein [Puccinia graminis f. sp. tritici]|uniref:Thiamine metabolism-protein n=1 Tax=Puccinia graminis f. sp. tritici TaxID=56615 RepID=A0A5B0LYZ5_PUCGR|nr:thiamine metabolism- protein [Puccinia graminis f. sp. tritici]
MHGLLDDHCATPVCSFAGHDAPFGAFCVKRIASAGLSDGLEDNMHLSSTWNGPRTIYR